MPAPKDTTPLNSAPTLTDRIYVAGHRGLVGSALVRVLRAQGFHNLLLRTHAELDLTDASATRAFFETERPNHVFLAAARVGGILANNNYPADFIRDNLAIQTNVIHEAWRAGVKRLLFLGSSCIYPKHAPQPIQEAALLTGPLEPTNRPYALAKIAGIELCWSYNRQHHTGYLAAMPTNLYGPGDNYDLANSHVLPALIRKAHEAKLAGQPTLVVWGTGTPRREFLYSDDMAAACVHLMRLPEPAFDALLGVAERGGDPDIAPLVNVGSGEDHTILELAQTVAEVVGFTGQIVLDPSKPDGTPRKLMDSSRLRAQGWAPSVGLREGIGRAYQDFLERKNERKIERPGV
jgi:GDP-L-fucose synthase